jgi:hypothetical protein
MNWDAIIAVSEVLGVVAVVVTLLYLARQVKRSDDAARAASVESVLGGFRDRIGSPAARDGSFADCMAHGLNSLESLSDTDKRRFFYIVSEYALHMQNVLQLYERKLLTKGGRKQTG